MPAYRIRAYTYLFMATLIWGAAASVAKFTLTGIDPLPFLAYRFILSGVGAWILLFLQRKQIYKLTKAIIPCTAYAIIALPVTLSLLFFGLQNTTVLETGIITASAPLIVSVLGVVVFRDRITKREKVGTAIALAGSLFVTVVPLLMGNGTAELHFSANVLIILYLLADTLGTTCAKIATKKGVPSSILTQYAFALAPFILVPIAYFQYGNFLPAIMVLPLPYHLAIWFMAFGSGLTAYYLFIRGQQSIELSEAGLFWYLAAIFEVPLAILWLGESVTATYIIGAAVVILGVIIAETKSRARKRGKK